MVLQILIGVGIWKGHFFMKIDYEYKSYVLKEHVDLLKKQKRCKLYEYAIALKVNEGIISYALKTNNADYQPAFCLEQYACENNLLKELNECEKINHAEFKRTKRLKKRVASMLNGGPCLFLTLTFTDNTLAETSQKQRRVAVCRFLKELNCRYVANIDFGVDETKTMREHYHALVQYDYLSKDYMNEWRDKYGNIDAEKVRLRNGDNATDKMSKYIAKLSNHAIKEMARRSALIYSR